MAGLKQALETGDSADLCSALLDMLSRGIELDAAAEPLSTERARAVAS